MLVQLENAMQTVDAFEELLLSKGISIPANPSIAADMLPLWQILKHIRGGFNETPDILREEYTAGMAVHDMASKVLAVENHPDFDMLIPHLEMLVEGAVHLTQEPPYESADVYNKLIELYWACLLMANGGRIDLDHPKHSVGNNPDVIVRDGDKSRAYAFKTVRSLHTQSLFEHLKKGVDQIERSEASEGIVVFHLTPCIMHIDLWSKDKFYEDWSIPTAKVVELFIKMISQVVIDNGQTAIDAVFLGKKAVGTVLCLAMFPIVARNPLTQNPIVMPIKVPILVEMSPICPISVALHREIESANNAMQLKL